MPTSSSIAHFLGYSTTHKGYKCFHIPTDYIYIFRHVIFNEEKFPFQKNSLTTPNIISTSILPPIPTSHLLPPSQLPNLLLIPPHPPPQPITPTPPPLPTPPIPLTLTPPLEPTFDTSHQSNETHPNLPSTTFTSYDHSLQRWNFQTKSLLYHQTSSSLSSP